MRPLPLVAWVTALSACAGILPAVGQVLPIEMIFPPARPAVQGFSRSAAPLPTAASRIP